jgi:hypothetical protein
LSLVLLAILGFAAVLLADPVSVTVSAQEFDVASVYHVAPDCTGITPPCYTTVQDAVDVADSAGDIIQVAQGTYTDIHARDSYTQMVYLTKTVTIRGGFSPDFSVWDPDAYPTVLDAQRPGRVFYIQGPGSPVIEGLQITGGDGSAGGGDWGGGIFAVGGSGPSLALTLRYNQVISNYATADLGTGGGLAAVFSNVILEDNLFAHNEAVGAGGGARFEQTNAELQNNIFRDNRTQGSGGGIYLAYLNHVEMTNTVMIDNQAAYAGGAMVASGAYMRMLHTTVARNSSGDGTGISVVSGGTHGQIPSTVLMTNSILVSHTVGLTVYHGAPWYTNTATLDSTLWDGVGQLAGGGGNLALTLVYVGDPAFAADGYHLLPTSDAIDLGVDAGVQFDIDDQYRPALAGYDLGADEVLIYSFLPLVLRAYGP